MLSSPDRLSKKIHIVYQIEDLAIKFIFLILVKKYKSFMITIT